MWFKKKRKSRTHLKVKKVITKKMMNMMRRRARIVELVECDKKIKNNSATEGILYIKETYHLKALFLKIRIFFLIRI